MEDQIQSAVDVLNHLTMTGSGSVDSSLVSLLVAACGAFLDHHTRQRCTIRMIRRDKAARCGGLIGGVVEPKPVPHLTESHQLFISRRCYICKRSYNMVHHFYDSMCNDCAQFNLAKREQTWELYGYTCVVTGGRVKIGFEICLKLLRAGADVFCTTRFPVDARRRYERQTDYPCWQHRLTIVKLDLQFIEQIDAFILQVKEAFPDGLSVLIQNAAQTIARPAESMYRNELMLERGQQEASPLTSDCLSDALFPHGRRDENDLQVDMRSSNTWSTPLENTTLGELVQVTAINYVAPYYILTKLHALLEKEGRKRPSIVVNVTAVEGQFSGLKTGFHAHTNGAKAALNMITRTVGHRWQQQNIYVSCVDTGWITNEYAIGSKDGPDKYHPPLDEVDGASRVLDPVFAPLVTGEAPPAGVFFKDYKVSDW